MSHDLTASAEVMWYSDEEDSPEHWSEAVAFSTFSAAMEAILTGAPQTGHPWIRCGGRIFAPPDIEALLQDDGTG